MTDAAFRATYSDWKVVKGRKVIQVVLELPLEAADQAYQVLGGMPMAANEIWCAVARLRENNDEVALSDGSRDRADNACSTVVTATADKPKKSPAQIAGYLCTTIPFHRFLQERFEPQWLECTTDTYNDAETAAAVVRHLCDVDSRADIKPDSTEWLSLMLAYKLWQNHPELEDA